MLAVVKLGDAYSESRLAAHFHSSDAAVPGQRREKKSERESNESSSKPVDIAMVGAVISTTK